jgi:Domain of Unknown Function (DUF928)
MKFNPSNTLKMNISLGWKLALIACLISYPAILQLNLTTAIAAPIKLKLPPPPQRGIAGNRSAAASRDTCPTVAQPLTALVPEYRSTQGNRVWGLTGVDHPTLLVYVPYGKNAIVDLSFTLQDESNPADTQIIYQNPNLAPAATPGIMRIALPKFSKPLVANKPYHWFLKLNMGCTAGQRPIFVDGWVQRADLDRTLSDQLKQASPTGKIALSAENGLWYDALNSLASLRAAKPQDPGLKQDWQNLLKSIDLGDLANQPLSENGAVDRVQRLKSK